MIRIDSIFRQDKENQAKNVLLNLPDEAEGYRGFIQQFNQTCIGQPTINNEKNQKKSQLQRFSRQKCNRRCLKQIGFNVSNAQKQGFKKIKYISDKSSIALNHQKFNNNARQTIKQLKNILQKLQQKNFNVKQQVILKTNLQEVKRTISLKRKNVNLSFKESKDKNLYEKSNQQTNLTKYSKTKSTEKFYKQNFFNENYKKVNTQQIQLKNTNIKDSKLICKNEKIRNKFCPNQKFDHLSLKTLNILAQINNIKTMNVNRRKSGSFKNDNVKFIKQNSQKDKEQYRHFLSVRT